MSPERTTWAVTFKTFRKRWHITREELARAMEMSVRGIQYIENGKREPRIATVGKFYALQNKYLEEEKRRAIGNVRTDAPKW